MATLVLLRHGETIWDKENRFTGWEDAGLTAKGHDSAREAGRLSRNEGLAFATLADVMRKETLYRHDLDRLLSRPQPTAAWKGRFQR
jgi:bisphosphoglycerate-dependent phosphoglycerate mutase